MKTTAYVTICLAFVAGFADAATFVGAEGIFCAHVTGNFVVLAADLARSARADEWLKLATFPLFVGAVLAATRFHVALGREPARAMRHLLVLESVLFGAAIAVAVAHPSLESGPARSAVVGLLVVAMAIQNAIHRIDPSLGPMTTVMTGNVTQWLVQALVPGSPEAAPQPSNRGGGARSASAEGLRGVPQGAERPLGPHRALGLLIAAFTLGCVAGAVGVAKVGFVALAAPLVVVLGARALAGRA